MKGTSWEEETKLPLVTSCKQAARLVSISFERRLTLREFITMRIHLLSCKTCNFYRREISALRRLFIKHEELLDNTPPSGDECLDEAARKRIKEALARSTKSGGSEVANGDEQ
ncbi:MAG: hypothetical protein HGA80_05805 [Candidatus Omnitrophica bacterium]|nr:hypothetical protein [Candidatus Omnitrophota bacterium]